MEQRTEHQDYIIEAIAAKKKNGMLFIDEEEARVVRRIYECYFEGYSTGGIIDKQEEKKIKPSKGKVAIESTPT